MIGRMNLLLHIGSRSQHVVQHNLPWLAVLAMLFGFGRVEIDRPLDPDERAG